MGYREVSRMEVDEVRRRAAAGESQRQIACALGLARNTVATYLRHASDDVASSSLPLRRSPGPAPGHAPELARLHPYTEQIGRWLQQERLQLTRVQELLGQQGLRVTYTTLRRFVRQAGLRHASAMHTVRMAPTAPGEVAEMDFEKLGPLLNPLTGKRQVVWGLSVVLVYSRHSFLFPLVQQTVEATIEGLEAAWRFFGGVPRRLILDNFPAAVAGTDPRAPKPPRAFLEYSQARGFLLDPARVRHPKDKDYAAYCTSSGRKSTSWRDGCREAAGLPGMLARERLVGGVQVIAAIVGRHALNPAAPSPVLQRCRPYAQTLGQFVTREVALGPQPLRPRAQPIGDPHRAHAQPGKGHATAGRYVAGRQDGRDLGFGVRVQQPVDLGHGGRIGLAQHHRAQRQWDLPRLRGAAAEPNVRGDHRLGLA